MDLRDEGLVFEVYFSGAIGEVLRTLSMYFTERGRKGGGGGVWGWGGGGDELGQSHWSSFDPFKSQSFSKNAQIAGADPTKLHPDMPAGYKGATERELEELRDKKRKLEEKREKEHGGGKLFDRMLKGVRKGEGDD